MIKYIVVVDMTLLLTKLKKFRLDKFNKNIAKIEIRANDPDDACHSAFKELCDMILEQDQSTDTKLLLKNLKYDFRVAKLNAKRL